MVTGRRRRGIARTAGAAALVAALSFAHIAAQLGAAFAAPPTVECCCGEHDAEVDCGCPDCLGGSYSWENARERRGSSADHIRPCGQERDEVVPNVSASHWDVVPVAAGPPRARPTPPARTIDALPPSVILDGLSAPS